MPDIFDELDKVESSPKKDIFDELEPSRPSTGALGTRFKPSSSNPFAVEHPSESAFGIGPQEIPSGADTKSPLLTIPISVAGKTAAGVAGYLTSPQGVTETALAATPLAPAVFAKWAYDMAKGGYKSVKGIVDEVGQMANEAFNKGVITQNQLGPIPEGTTPQEHIQSLAENAANAALMGLGAFGAASHVKLPSKVVPDVPGVAETPKPPTPEALKVEPSGDSGVPQPSAEPVGASKETPVAAGETPQPIAETPTPQTVPQPESVTPPVTEDIPQPGPGTIGDAEMGAAGVREIPDTGAGGEKYGVAERVRAERAQAGQVDPVPSGKGMSTEQTIAMGRDIVRRDPEAGPRIMAQFENNPKREISAEGIAVVRAHGESLAAGARTIEDNYGTESPEYQQAKNYLSDWDRRTKAMQTEWHKQGMAQQGETDIDTGSFTGLQRARQQATGEDIPAAKKPQARKIAAQNKSAQGELDKASESLKSRIREKKPTDPEKAAIDAANKTVTEAAARLADAENKARVAEEVRKQSVEQVQKDSAEAAGENQLKIVRDEAVRKARAENKARVAEAIRQKNLADIERERSQKALDAAKKREVEARNKAIKESQRRANDPSIAVWEAANKELEATKGLGSFDDIRNKVAADLGMPVSKVTSIMAQDATTKRLAEDVWAKQRNARRLKETAKRWLRELDTPGYQKALATVPRSMFALSVFGHGFVALGTHAPIVAFQPKFWGAYIHNFGRMYKLVFSPAYYEAQMQDLVRRSHTETIRGKEVQVNDWELANKAGLQNDPFQYEEYQTQAIRDLATNWLGEKNMDRLAKLTGGGNRGYSVLKVLRQDMFDQAWNRLPQSIKVQEGVAEAIADGINHATGVTKKGAHPGFAVALFAPRLAASRVMWLGGDPVRAGAAILNWKNATTAERLFAENQMREKAWVFGTFASLLAINQGFLSASGSDQKINGIPEALGGAGFDPMASDFLKFKVHGANVAYGGALLTLCKLPVRVGYAIAYEGKGSKYVLEEERVDKVLLGYARTQASPFAGTVADLALGRDFEQRPLPAKLFGAMEQTGAVPKRLAREGIEPYSWLEYAGTRLPIPVAEALKEGLKGSGMPDDQVKYWTKGLGIAIIMTGTGTRITEDTRD